jgi:hypothetical protein
LNVTAFIGQAQRRLRIREALASAAAGLVLLALTVTAAGLAGRTGRPETILGMLLALLVAITSARRAIRRWTPLTTASYVEAAAGGMDNLLVTATALDAGALAASLRMRAEVLKQAELRTETLAPASVAPLRTPLALVLAALIGAIASTWSTALRHDGTATNRVLLPDAARIVSIRATITPPDYLGVAPQPIDDPAAVSVLDGSRIRIEIQTSAAAAWLVEPGQANRSLAADGSQRFAIEWQPASSTAVVLAVGDDAGDAVETRVVNVVVTPDTAPRVRIASPGRDLAFGSSSAVVDVAIEASDAERVDGLRVAYVKTSGSGESFAFAEGQLPVAIERVSSREWRGRARLSLAALELEDGDSVVYRALVRDSNPRGDWVASDAFTIDVGRRLELASAGAAVPDEDRRYALSQQMVIVKTERLQGRRTQLAPDTWAEQTRLLAMEQRMVRAEVVFLSGGEVVDEVEEAQQSGELQEGRLQNAGRVEMLKAINEMSRAEARLNAGDAGGALRFERAALAALQRAFDRRRYFLRTLGERSRIDPTRRLAGDLAKARSSGRSVRSRDSADADAARELVRGLAAVNDTGEPPGPAVLGQLASLDPGSADWRQLAANLTAAMTPDQRRQAARLAMARVAAHARERAGVSAFPVSVNDLRGWWREEWRPGGRP